MGRADLTEASLTCPSCGHTTYHPEDIRHRFCVACGFYDQEGPATATNRHNVQGRVIVTQNVGRRWLAWVDGAGAKMSGRTEQQAIARLLIALANV